jgi:hypothetical protein
MDRVRTIKPIPKKKRLNERISALLITMVTTHTTILPLILYGCETWSLTIRDERRLRVFENGVLRRIFGPKRVKMTGGRRKLHNEDLHMTCTLRQI